MAVAEVGVNAATPGHVGGVVGIGQGKAFQDSELRFDQVEPGGLPWASRQGECAVVVAGRGSGDDCGRCVGCPKSRTIACADNISGGSGRLCDVQDPFVTTKQATEAIGVHIIESQKLFGPLQTVVGWAYTPGLLVPGPSDTTDRFQIQRTPFVETHYRAARWTAPIERPDEFFYGRTRDPSRSSRCGRS